MPLSEAATSDQLPAGKRASIQSMVKGLQATGALAGQLAISPEGSDQEKAAAQGIQAEVDQALAAPVRAVAAQLQADVEVWDAEH